MRSSYAAVFFAAAVATYAPSESPPETGADDPTSTPRTMAGPLNLPTKTAGGTQLWTDHRWHDGWRVQQNALTGHWRLLDPGDIRRGWGSREACLGRLEQSISSSTAPPPPGERRYVILLHGLMRTHHSMKPMERGLREAGYEHVIRFSYASTRGSIAEHAGALRELIEALPRDSDFRFVGHSMGNIVVRYLVGELQAAGDPQEVLQRCRAMVMLGPPNRGAAIARRLGRTGLYGLVTGPGGVELGAAWDQLAERLATPPFPFAIIAGDRSESVLQNPLVAPEGDYIVSVDEARLEGAEVFRTVPVVHAWLMRDENVIRESIAFLRAHECP